MLEIHSVQLWGAGIFGLAVLHTFLTQPLLKFSHRFERGSALESIFHLLGEIEVVFGIWAAVFLGISGFTVGITPVRDYLENLHFTEPIFVFVVMVISSSKPIMFVARRSIQMLSSAIRKVTGIPAILVDVFVVLAVGPLLGSLITEPAAMTVTALLLYSLLRQPSVRMMYFALAVLFVNVSIGGALSHFAAPPILMVAGTWGWDTSFVFSHFGWKATAAVAVNATMFTAAFRRELQREGQALLTGSAVQKIPFWVWSSHVLFLLAVILSAHYSTWLMALFLFFLGVSTVTQKYQERLRLRESLLVAFFLGGIIVFGSFQRWWLEPLLASLNDRTLFFSSIALTSVTDNAALTYLGSQVKGLSEISKYYLVAGAISGGGLTVIANAPNAAGLSILQKKFPSGFNPVYLFLAALPPTLVAVIYLQ